MKDPKNILHTTTNKKLNKFSFNKIMHKSSLFCYLALFIFIINFKDISTIQEINITINGTGTQQIIYKYFSKKTNKILVNGILQNDADDYVYNLTHKINIITMRWDEKLKSCFNMFCGLNNIIGFDFSNFDTSEVTSMAYMLQNVNSLKILDLSNFITSSVTSMYYMFDGCSSLVSLNLSNFNTSKVTSFGNMFNGCNSLIYLNLNSFIIQDYAGTYDILSGTSGNLLLCYDISKASSLTSQLKGLSNSCDNKCFKKGAKLIIDNKTCIEECDNNIYKYEYKNICFKSYSEMSDYLYGIYGYEIDCKNKTNKDEIPDGYYLSLNDTNNKTIDKCNIKCKTCNNESNINDLCLSCNIENGYYPIINNNSNINSYFNCYNYTPSGFAFDNFTYKPCYSTCKDCITIGDNYNHQCL